MNQPTLSNTSKFGTLDDALVAASAVVFLGAEVRRTQLA